MRSCALRRQYPSENRRSVVYWVLSPEKSGLRCKGWLTQVETLVYFKQEKSVARSSIALHNRHKF